MCSVDSSLPFFRGVVGALLFLNFCAFNIWIRLTTAAVALLTSIRAFPSHLFLCHSNWFSVNCPLSLLWQSLSFGEWGQPHHQPVRASSSPWPSVWLLLPMIMALAGSSGAHGTMAQKAEKEFWITGGKWCFKKGNTSVMSIFPPWKIFSNGLLCISDVFGCTSWGSLFNSIMCFSEIIQKI